MSWGWFLRGQRHEETMEREQMVPDHGWEHPVLGAAFCPASGIPVRSLRAVKIGNRHMRRPIILHQKGR